MEKEGYLIISYIFLAALCWHLVRCKSIPGPWEGMGGGYPRAILLFPYYLPVYIMAFAIVCSDKISSKMQPTTDGQIEPLRLLDKIIVAVGFLMILVSDMTGLFDSEEGHYQGEEW